MKEYECQGKKFHIQEGDDCSLIVTYKDVKAIIDVSESPNSPPYRVASVGGSAIGFTFPSVKSAINAACDKILKFQDRIDTQTACKNLSEFAKSLN